MGYVSFRKIFVFVKYPEIKKQASRFKIDNNFSALIIRHHGIAPSALSEANSMKDSTEDSEICFLNIINTILRRIEHLSCLLKRNHSLFCFHFYSVVSSKRAFSSSSGLYPQATMFPSDFRVAKATSVATTSFTS